MGVLGIILNCIWWRNFSSGALKDEGSSFHYNKFPVQSELDVFGFHLLSILADLNNVLVWMDSTWVHQLQLVSWSPSCSIAFFSSIIIIIIIIIIPWECFTSALADNHSLEFEWQQFSSSLQHSSQYSGLSQ